MDWAAAGQWGAGRNWNPNIFANFTHRNLHEDDVGINNIERAGSNLSADKSGGNTGLKEIADKIYYLVSITGQCVAEA